MATPFTESAVSSPAVPHVIRLRGPWQYTVVARSVLLPDGSSTEVETDLPPPGKLDMPADWDQSPGRDFHGRVNYSRSFGAPTGLEAGDRVELVVERVNASGQVWFNGVPLGEIPAGANTSRFDVRRLLKPRNQLVVQVCRPKQSPSDLALPQAESGDSPGGLLGEVRLEIFAAGS